MSAHCPRLVCAHHYVYIGLWQALTELRSHEVNERNAC